MGDPAIRRRSRPSQRKNRTLTAEPNAVHRAVDQLGHGPVHGVHAERGRPHRLAGTPAREVLELHGSAQSFMCTGCQVRGSAEDTIARVKAAVRDPGNLWPERARFPRTTRQHWRDHSPTLAESPQQPRSEAGP
jgi:NAD-dependent deacetylase